MSAASSTSSPIAMAKPPSVMVLIDRPNALNTSTVMPFLVRLYEAPWSTMNITLVWALALAGAAGKILAPSLSDRFWCVVYIAFGWLSVALIGPFATHMPLSVIVLLASGGLVYTVGVLFYLSHSLPFRRAIWHAFVIVGAGLHFAAIAAGVVFG